MKSNHHKIFVVDQNNIRIDIFLSSKIEDFSRSKIKKLIVDGKILMDNHPVKPSLILSQGQEIFCDLSIQEKENILEPQKIDFDIIFEDEHFIVINKPAGLVVHPGNANYSNTLANGLLYYLKDISALDPLRPGIVHRLDMDTSGIIVTVKNEEAHHVMSKLFEKRKVEKEYKAIVWGTPEGSGVIKNYIQRDLRNKTAFRVSDTTGREAITKYKVIDSFGPLSLVNLYPKTGRTHQLRVHMKSIGHSIFADDKYSGGNKNIKSFHSRYSSILRRCFKIAKRQMLHASSIKFIHPFTDKKLKFKTKLPSDMLNLIKLLKDEF